jgi:metal-responsive CopG/Arc/MetJ family transcriptional regulator
VRTLVDIPDNDVQRLNRLSKDRKVSRAHLVRTAVAEYLRQEEPDSLDKLFGIWKDRNIDGLEYQEQMRREWEREY